MISSTYSGLNFSNFVVRASHLKFVSNFVLRASCLNSPQGGF